MTIDRGNELSTEVITPTESIEYDLPKISLPEKKDEKILKEFFSDPEKLSRLIYCPHINIDSTDAYGMFGDEPGFFFVKGSNYKGAKSSNDEDMLKGGVFKDLKTKSGHQILEVSHYDFFPHSKFEYYEITHSKNPKIFSFLRNLLDGVDKDDLSTYPTEDLMAIYNDLRWSTTEINYKIKQFQEHPYKEREAIVKKWIQESPQNTLDRLKLFEEMRKRGLFFSGPFFDSYQEEVTSINKDIKQAELNKDNKMAEEILSTFNKINQFLENDIYQEVKNPLTKLLDK